MDLAVGKMKKLFLIRHGQTEQNGEPRYFGVTDLPLSTEGCRQAQLIADSLCDEQINALFTSPLCRSLETAGIIAEDHKLEARIVRGLSEIDFGQWEGLSFDEIRSRNPEQVSRWLNDPWNFAFPAGQSVQHFRSHVIEVIEQILDVAGNVAVVAHGGSLRVIICHLCGWPINSFHSFSLDTASITVLEHFGDTTIVKTLNDTCHLQTER